MILGTVSPEVTLPLTQKFWRSFKFIKMGFLLHLPCVWSNNQFRLGPLFSRNFHILLLLRYNVPPQHVVHLLKLQMGKWDQHLPGIPLTCVYVHPPTHPGQHH